MKIRPNPEIEKKIKKLESLDREHTAKRIREEIAKAIELDRGLYFIDHRLDEEIKAAEETRLRLPPKT